MHYSLHSFTTKAQLEAGDDIKGIHKNCMKLLPKKIHHQKHKMVVGTFEGFVRSLKHSKSEWTTATWQNSNGIQQLPESERAVKTLELCATNPKPSKSKFLYSSSQDRVLYSDNRFLRCVSKSNKMKFEDLTLWREYESLKRVFGDQDGLVLFTQKQNAFRRASFVHSSTWSLLTNTPPKLKMKEVASNPSLIHDVIYDQENKSIIFTSVGGAYLTNQQLQNNSLVAHLYPLGDLKLFDVRKERFNSFAVGQKKFQNQMTSLFPKTSIMATTSLDELKPTYDLILSTFFHNNFSQIDQTIQMQVRPTSFSHGDIYRDGKKIIIIVYKHGYQMLEENINNEFEQIEECSQNVMLVDEPNSCEFGDFFDDRLHIGVGEFILTNYNGSIFSVTPLIKNRPQLKNIILKDHEDISKKMTNQISSLSCQQAATFQLAQPSKGKNQEQTIILKHEQQFLPLQKQLGNLNDRINNEKEETRIEFANKFRSSSTFNLQNPQSLSIEADKKDQFAQRASSVLNIKLKPKRKSLISKNVDSLHNNQIKLLSSAEKQDKFIKTSTQIPVEQIINEFGYQQSILTPIHDKLSLNQNLESPNTLSKVKQMASKEENKKEEFQDYQFNSTNNYQKPKIGITQNEMKFISDDFLELEQAYQKTFEVIDKKQKINSEISSKDFNLNQEYLQIPQIDFQNRYNHCEIKQKSSLLKKKSSLCLGIKERIQQNQEQLSFFSEKNKKDPFLNKVEFHKQSTNSSKNEKDFSNRQKDLLLFETEKCEIPLKQFENVVPQPLQNLPNSASQDELSQEITPLSSLLTITELSENGQSTKFINQNNETNKIERTTNLLLNFNQENYDRYKMTNAGQMFNNLKGQNIDRQVKSKDKVNDEEKRKSIDELEEKCIEVDNKQDNFSNLNSLNNNEKQFIPFKQKNSNHSKNEVSIYQFEILENNLNKTPDQQQQIINKQKEIVVEEQINLGELGLDYETPREIISQFNNLFHTSSYSGVQSNQSSQKYIKKPESEFQNSFDNNFFDNPQISDYRSDIYVQLNANLTNQNSLDLINHNKLLINMGTCHKQKSSIRRNQSDNNQVKNVSFKESLDKDHKKISPKADDHSKKDLNTTEKKKGQDKNSKFNNLKKIGILECFWSRKDRKQLISTKEYIQMKGKYNLSSLQRQNQFTFQDQFEDWEQNSSPLISAHKFTKKNKKTFDSNNHNTILLDQFYILQNEVNALEEEIKLLLQCLQENKNNIVKIQKKSNQQNKSFSQCIYFTIKAKIPITLLIIQIKSHSKYQLRQYEDFKINQQNKEVFPIIFPSSQNYYLFNQDNFENSSESLQKQFEIVIFEEGHSVQLTIIPILSDMISSELRCSIEPFLIFGKTICSLNEINTSSHFLFNQYHCLELNNIGENQPIIGLINNLFDKDLFQKQEYFDLEGGPIEQKFLKLSLKLLCEQNQIYVLSESASYLRTIFIKIQKQFPEACYDTNLKFSQLAFQKEFSAIFEIVRNESFNRQTLAMYAAFTELNSIEMCSCYFQINPDNYFKQSKSHQRAYLAAKIQMEENQKPSIYTLAKQDSLEFCRRYLDNLIKVVISIDEGMRKNLEEQRLLIENSIFNFKLETIYSIIFPGEVIQLP